MRNPSEKKIKLLASSVGFTTNKSHYYYYYEDTHSPSLPQEEGGAVSPFEFILPRSRLVSMWTLSGNIKFFLKFIGIGIPAGVTFTDVVGYVAKVEGSSMQPVFNPDPRLDTDYVFLYNWPVATNAYEEISRGDIVAFISPRDPRQRMIKRVIGLGGDVIHTKGHKKPLVRVPTGHCWVEGDHHGHSLDSNIFGPLALGLVKSKAKCIVWPPKRWTMLTNTTDDTLLLGKNEENELFGSQAPAVALDH